MKYSKYTPEENQKIGRLWGGGHTDLGSWTLLFRQPVAALQLKDPDGNWRWVQHKDNALVCDSTGV